MTKTLKHGLPLLVLALQLSSQLHAETAVELETTRITTNEELPQVLFIVPWKDLATGPARRYKLQLHNLFGDLYQPQLPANPPGVNPQQLKAPDQDSS